MSKGSRGSRGSEVPGPVVSAAGGIVVAGIEMLTSYELADAAVDAREVVETFRQAGTLVDDWDSVLRCAADAIERAAGCGSSAGRLPTDLTALVVLLRRTTRHPLAGDEELLDRVSAELETLVEVSRPAGLPGPNDLDWSF
jgi:hypothetical protein